MPCRNLTSVSVPPAPEFTLGGILVRVTLKSFDVIFDIGLAAADRSGDKAEVEPSACQRLLLGQNGTVLKPRSEMSPSDVPTQPIDATHELNRSAGVSKSNVFLGRPFSCRATALSFACECSDRSVPFGKYWRSKPLVFSFEPRCHGLCGSQKYTWMSVASVNLR